MSDRSLRNHQCRCQGGWIYDPVGPLAVAQCWEGLLTNLEELRETGARAQSAVTEKFSHLSMAARVAAVVAAK